MRRRNFIAGLASTTATWPPAARAQQQPDRVRRVGICYTDPELKARVAAFKRQLQELNWFEGRNVHIDLRFGRGDKDRLRANAQELIGLTPDVITANSAPAVLELARQTKVIPIVFANVFDPLGSGLVASLAQPSQVVGALTKSGSGT